MKRFRLNLSVNALFVFLSAVLISFSASGKDMTGKELVEGAKTTIKSISIADARALLGKSGAVFLDVREPEEFKAGHIPGAINIPRGLLEFQIEQQAPDKNTTIVVYCRSGNRSALAAATLMNMGYKNVFNVDGGWKTWQEAGYPVE